MSQKHISPIVNATIKLIASLSGVSPLPGDPFIRNNNKAPGKVTSIIGLTGQNTQGNLAISFDEKSIVFIVNKMLSESYTQINADIIDACGEICNMLAGGSKKALAEELGYQCDMAQPIVISGDEIEISPYLKTTLIAVPFSIEDGQFWIITPDNINKSN
jgi:chemotaxis protein CheX